MPHIRKEGVIDGDTGDPPVVCEPVICGPVSHSLTSQCLCVCGIHCVKKTIRSVTVTACVSYQESKSNQ